jgi:sRNA-binding protein
LSPAYKWLRRTYPEAFRQFYTQVEIDGMIEDRPFRRPLKLGTARELLAARPASVSKRAIRKALAAWTRHDVYLMALTMAGAMRINLKGEMVERVSPVHRKLAYAMLSKRRAERRLKESAQTGRASWAPSRPPRRSAA